MYVFSSKVLYVLLKSAFLFYKNIYSDLKKLGFKKNLYSVCVSNYMIKGSKITITWHVYGVDIFHNGANKVTKFI